MPGSFKRSAVTPLFNKKDEVLGVSGENLYETRIDEVQIEQEERMVQKAMYRKKLDFKIETETEAEPETKIEAEFCEKKKEEPKLAKHNETILNHYFVMDCRESIGSYNHSATEVINDKIFNF